MCLLFEWNNVNSVNNDVLSLACFWRRGFNISSAHLKQFLTCAAYETILQCGFKKKVLALFLFARQCNRLMLRCWHYFTCEGWMRGSILSTVCLESSKTAECLHNGFFFYRGFLQAVQQVMVLALKGRVGDLHHQGLSGLLGGLWTDKAEA